MLLLALPVAAHAATLTFGGPVQVMVGDMVSVPVLLSTSGSESANAVSATISYSTNLLTLVSISKAQSIITLWAQEPTISGGNAQLEGVILNPGWSGKSGIVATLVFQVKAKGTGTLTFADADAYANDGNATPILSSSPSKSFTIKETAPGATSTTPGVVHTTPASTATTTATSSEAGMVTEPEVPAAPAVTFFDRIKGYAVRALPYLPYALGLILLILLLALIVHKLRQFFGGVRTYKKLKRDSVQGNIHQHFHELRDAVADEMVLLAKAKTKRELTKEEERFLVRFKKLLDKTEKNIEKEISK
ncbi:MAG TPA: cohesin domain-containing protein [Candidatus Paceibacterota bacterium]|nr:cohesin domain-containing protein [Candidatus Paceibacterota bacterium]